MAYTVASIKEDIMRAGLAMVVGLVVGAVGALTAQKLLIEGRPKPSPVPSAVPTAPPPTLPPAMCEAVVRITLESNGRPKATPDVVCLARNRELSWDIDSQLEAGELKLEFDLQGADKGPFLEDQQNPHNMGQGRGRYVRAKGDKRPIRSNAAEKVGRWKYSVTYTPPNGTPMTLDPAVCIRN